jgi:hypothetical protein
MSVFRKIRVAVAVVAAAGVMGGIMAAVPMQTTQDSADGNRLVINGKRLFISGMNIAWNDFANDVGDQGVKINAFVNQFKQIREAGGNAVRWWLHTDNQNCPKLDANGAVTGIGSKTISNMRQVLDSAYNYGIVVSMCLFSFDLLQGENKSNELLTQNKKFLTVESNLETYIENALRPILDAVGNHPAIMCWEAFNEPEGMAIETSGWATEKIAHSHILRFTNKIAGEVHRRTKKMASTGIHNFSQNERSRYSTTTLVAAGGDDDGYLDFYMAHYYPEWGASDESPFHNQASFWGFDKPVLIGEFPARSWSTSDIGTDSKQPYKTSMNINAAFEYAFDNGYCGAMSWAMTEENTAKFGNFNTTKPALENLYAKHEADIKIKDVIIENPTGDLAMKLTMTNMPQEGTAANGGPWNDLGVSTNQDFTGKTKLTFDMYIEPGSGTHLTIVPVAKSGPNSNWAWSPAPSFTLSNKPQGEWFPVEVPVNTFQASDAGKTFDPNDVREILIQYFAKGAPYNGAIYFDNFKLDDDAPLFDFNQSGSEWNTAADGASVSLVQRPGTTSAHNGGKKVNMAARAPLATVNGKTLKITGLGSAETSVKLVNLKGKTVANFRAVGNASFGLSDIPAGNYLVELTANGKKLGSSRVTFVR